MFLKQAGGKLYQLPEQTPQQTVIPINFPERQTSKYEKHWKLKEIWCAFILEAFGVESMLT